MKTFLALLAFLGTAAAQWPHLKTTFGIDGIGVAFDSQPRTQAELDADNWVQISSCADGMLDFPGDRYARSLDDNDMVLIFDGNGYIAGMQSILPIDKAMDDEYYPFSQSVHYQMGEFNGEDVYFVTIYLVDPSIICNGGRTEAEFEAQGTGDRVMLQDGLTSLSVRNIPLTIESMRDDAFWYEHNCFTNMEIHFFTINKQPDMPCDDSIAPLQVVYDLDGNLNGFVFQHVTALDSNRFETVTLFALNSIVQDAPQCLKDATSEPGISTMHVYVSGYDIACP